MPERELYIGHASGSAMPLVWAHAEYLRLCRSRFDRRIFDQPPQTVERYLVPARRRDPDGVSRPAPLPTGPQRIVLGSQHPRTRPRRHSGMRRAPFRPTMGYWFAVTLTTQASNVACERRANQRREGDDDVSKERLHLTAWLKEVGPGTELRSASRAVVTRPHIVLLCQFVA
jgi:hypothetical protein